MSDERVHDTASTMNMLVMPPAPPRSRAEGLSPALHRDLEDAARLTDRAGERLL